MLTVEEKAACLQKGIFAGLDEETLLGVAKRMGERELADGQTLFLRGEAGDEIFVVVAGEVEIHLGEHTVAVLGAGQLFGEMAVLGGGRRTAGCRARGAAKLLFLKDKALRLLIQQMPGIAFAIFKLLADRLDEANRLNRFLGGARRALGELRLVAGAGAGKTFPLYHDRAAVGRALGGAADALRVALPCADGSLLENHAELSISRGLAFIEPLDGEVLVNGEPLSDGMSIGADDRVRAGSAEFTVRLGGGDD